MWTSSRKRRAPVKAPIFDFEQFPQTNGNVYGIQTLRCLSHAKVVGFPIRREGLNEGRVKSKEQDDVGPMIFCNAVGSDR